jgi:hypothetical protein
MCLMFLPAAVQYAGEEKPRRHEIMGGIGIIHLLLKDDLVSPIRYSGETYALFARHVFHARSGFHTLSVLYDSGNLTSAISGINRSQGSYRRFRVTGGYAWAIYRFFKRDAVLFLGVLSDNQIVRREHLYINSNSELMFEYYTSIGPSLSVTYAPYSRHRFNAGFHGSVMAFIVKSPYAVRGHIGGSLKIFDSFKQFSTEVRYGYLIVPNVSFEISYFFNYYTHTFPRMVHSGSDTVILSLGVRI